ncbi:unnamed protein product [Penicillium camemberti]|uniref:Str. FM013 n=1 Tax=Penicillium camemberti (strain FM 013) TaxID=1429867 RepID=A0A0G4PLZ5_PENC3|nr:unnamed protein product [Penicillium camemberti]
MISDPVRSAATAREHSSLVLLLQAECYTSQIFNQVCMVAYERSSQQMRAGNDFTKGNNKR